MTVKELNEILQYYIEQGFEDNKITIYSKTYEDKIVPLIGVTSNNNSTFLIIEQ